jgi:caa(3)-type oxidase subunit IV
METHDREAFRKHLKAYIMVFVALLVGTVLTVAVSYVHFGHEDSHAGNIAVALVIAMAKAFLVAAFFMHLVSEKRSIYTVLVCTAFFFVGLMALTVWAMNDFPERTELLQSVPEVIDTPGGAHH